MSRVRLSGAGKAYRTYRRPQDRLRDLVFGTESFHAQWAIRGVDLVLEQGDSLGVIGNNGAGKSTLMKLVAGVLTPSCGHVEVNGRVTAILELGTGFHPEFTGRENLFYSAEVLGVPRQEIVDRADDILTFSELGDAIDDPIKTYSTGMVMRLGFSLMTSIHPDVLIVDEALAVGDQIFKQKCIKRMSEIRESGTAIMFSSHSMHQVTQFCDRAIWLEKGSTVALGPAAEIVDRYVAATGNADQGKRSAVNDIQQPEGQSENTRCRVTNVEVLNEGGTVIRRGEGLHVAVEFEVRVADRYNFGIAIDRRETGQRLAAETARDTGLPSLHFSPGEYRVEFSIDTHPLRRGGYLVAAGLLDESLLRVEGYRLAEIEVEDPSPASSPGMMRVGVQWDVKRSHYK